MASKCQINSTIVVSARKKLGSLGWQNFVSQQFLKLSTTHNKQTPIAELESRNLLGEHLASPEIVAWA